VRPAQKNPLPAHQAAPPAQRAPAVLAIKSLPENEIELLEGHAINDYLIATQVV